MPNQPKTKARCKVCGKPIHTFTGRGSTGSGEFWVHDQPYDPWTPPIHAPRPTGANRA